MKAAGRRGMKGLREKGVKGAPQRFWILDFELCGCLNGRKPDRVGAGCECCFEETVVGWAALAIRGITIKVYIPLIYIVNTSLQSKY